jgi:hypothetical protein
MMKSRRMRWTGHAARLGDMANAYKLLVGKLEGKRPLGKPRRRWEDNITKMCNIWGTLNSKGVLFAISLVMTSAGQPRE